MQNKGYVEDKVFHDSLKFATAKSLILIPVKIDGQTKNFIFDTGANLSLMQRDTITGKIRKVSGASKREIEFGDEIVNSAQIGNINFRDTYAVGGDLEGLKEQIPDFGGLIGQPIIKKANWLINYPSKSIEVSNKNLIDNSFQAIKIQIENGLPYTFIKIDGKSYKAIIDLGSTASLSVPKETPLANNLLNKYAFEENERDIWTIGGSQIVKEKVGTIPKISIGSIEFDNVYTDIRNSSRLRLGMKFFEEYILYIDNIERDFKIKM